MPSHTAAEVLIQLHDLGGYPWVWPAWQELTGIQHGLFPPDDHHLPTGWTRTDATDIMSFFHQYNQIPKKDTSARSRFASANNETVPGRRKWSDFVKKQWEKWGIHQLVVEGLRKHSIHPITIINGSTIPINLYGKFNNACWPHSELYTPMALDTIGMLIFGPEAFGDAEILAGPIRTCLTPFVQRSWARIREQVKQDVTKLDEIEKAALKAFEDLGQGRPTKTKITRSIRAVAKWRNITEVYSSREAMSKADDMLSELNRVMEGIGAHVPKAKSGPGKIRIKANTDAFKNLATEEDLAQLMHIYMEYFSPIDDDDTHALSTELTLSFGLTDTSGGDLGMEVESKMEPGILADRLGFLKQHLPHQFNQYRHHSSTPWDNPDLFNAFPVPDCLQPLRLHWHQLAGVHSIIRNTFTKVTSPDHCTGTLICDEVGLGKTALAITTMAFLSQCALLQAEGGDLPPILDDRPYVGESGQIEALPHLIVTPGTLQAQWIAELRTLFRPKSVDIFQYDSPKSGNKEFWSPTGPFHSSKQKPQNKIIIMSHSSLQNDMQRIYDTKETKKNMKRPWELPPLKIRSTTKGTVFGQSFLSVTLDEAHNARNLSLNYYASLRVFQQAIIKLALTGTPLLTGPKDIAMMGRLIAVPHFLSEASVVEEIEDKAAVRRAKRMDDDGRSLRIVQIESVRRMQTHFIGSILRRTTDSLTWDGRTLLNLPPHVDVIGILTLTKREMDIINVRAEAAKASVTSANETGKFQTRKFYHEYRGAVAYAKEDPEADNPVFKTRQEWEPAKSTKMDTCAKICKYYLYRDGAEPVSFQDGKVSFPRLKAYSALRGDTRTRKVLIYSEFPSMTTILRNVLQLYEVDSLSIDGNMSFEKRARIIAEFYKPNSPRVFIFSKVGSAGLNLAIADIVIFFDQPWSAQDERQIRGRCHRQPQQQTVYAIHLLADNSSDILLSGMAMGKKDMYEAFVNKVLGQELRDLLSGKGVYIPDHEIPDQSDEEDNIPKAVHAKKKKNKSTRAKTPPTLVQEPPAEDDPPQPSDFHKQNDEEDNIPQAVRGKKTKKNKSARVKTPATYVQEPLAEADASRPSDFHKQNDEEDNIPNAVRGKKTKKNKSARVKTPATYVQETLAEADPPHPSGGTEDLLTNDLVLPSSPDFGGLTSEPSTLPSAFTDDEGTDLSMAPLPSASGGDTDLSMAPAFDLFSEDENNEYDAAPQECSKHPAKDSPSHLFDYQGSAHAQKKAQGQPESSPGSQSSESDQGAGHSPCPKRRKHEAIAPYVVDPHHPPLTPHECRGPAIQHKLLAHTGRHTPPGSESSHPPQPSGVDTSMQRSVPNEGPDPFLGGNPKMPNMFHPKTAPFSSEPTTQPSQSTNAAPVSRAQGNVPERKRNPFAPAAAPLFHPKTALSNSEPTTQPAQSTNAAPVSRAQGSVPAKRPNPFAPATVPSSSKASTQTESVLAAPRLGLNNNHRVPRGARPSHAGNRIGPSHRQATRLGDQQRISAPAASLGELFKKKKEREGK